jgi:outer membrane PBP1 activator LpoA protein
MMKMNRNLHHPARERSSLASIAALLLLALAFAGCETAGVGRIASSEENRAERLAAGGDHAEAAGVYIELAVEATGAQRDRYTLLAVEQYLAAGDIPRARNTFRGVARPMQGALVAIWTTNRATFHLYDGEADAALDLLEPLSREPLSRRDRLQLQALRADAWIQKQDPVRAIQLMTLRETWVEDRLGIEQNRLRLWQGLLVSSPQSMRSSAELATDPVVRGWLTIGSLAASTGQQGVGWLNGLGRWREQHPTHPAMSVVGGIEVPDLLLREYPRQIALLLPLSGNAATAGEAVQNGFLGAYFAAATGFDDTQRIRIYDVNTEGGAAAAYATAVAEGAEFVVGPLLKRHVNELANDILVPVPVLTLNYLADDTLAPPGMYQFALAPEDEAISAARRAFRDGHTHGVALVPNNDWGRRLLTSFATEFEGLGGTLLDYRSYTPGVQDFSTEIETLMGLSGSVQRYRRLRANLGGVLQFDPRRREDTDFIFLATDAAAGRLLKAQLKFHYSGDIPVYSTSSVNSLDGRSNSDLNDIMFADTPWVVAPPSWISELPDQFADFWPEQRRLTRLHAMGYDAYNLIGSLHAARGGTIPDQDGATGELFLDANGRIHRRLAWAQFRAGNAVALPPQEETEVPVENIGIDDEIVAPDTADEGPWDREIVEL